jgi:hypothetical protein
MRYVDRALDVWMDPDENCGVLDEDDLRKVLEERPEVVGAVELGRHDLIARVWSGRFPRWPAA